jgi:hypothetical protein
MPLARFAKILLASVLGLALLAVGYRQGYRYYRKNLAAPRTGEVVYREECLRCHGPQGQGVAGKADEPLLGEKSPHSLTRYVAREMPEDNPESLSMAECEAVSLYIHQAFYSPEARARNHPPRLDLAHLTVRQYRESVTDLLGALHKSNWATTSGGLLGVYRESLGKDKGEAKLMEHVDSVVNFDFGAGPLPQGKNAEQFKINWSGSLLVPDTGDYDFRITSPNGVRLYVNPPSNGSEKNACIDLWVSSAMVRTGEAQVFLLGGRTYPLKIEFFKFKDKTAAVKLEWRPPGGAWTVIPAENLSPQYASPVEVLSVALPPDDASMGYERGITVSREWTEAVAKGALQAAALLGPRLYEYAGTSPTAPDKAAKLKAFSQRLAQLAFRRPLSEEQKQSIASLFKEDLPPEVSVKRALIRTLSSPYFLYPGTGPQDDYAVASRLALSLWDSLPDEPLLQAAAQGKLKTVEQVRVQAQRMLKDPRAKSKLRDFLHHWLHVEEGAEIAKDPITYPGFDQGVVMDLRTSLDLFTERVVWSETSDYRDLLLNKNILMNDRLAAFYGQKLPEGQGYRPVQMDADMRAGVLTHPYVLASFSYTKSTSPIHRGVFVTRNILGRMLKPPPMAIAFMDDKFDPSFTMREKVSELTAKPACMACHVTINPLGFSFERFDAVGRVRAMDNNKPVNDVAEYTAADGTVLKLAGARDVAMHAAESQAGQAGFVRNLFQAMVKQPPAAYAPETLNQLTEQFRKDHFHIRNLAVEVAVTAALTPAKSSTPATR